MAKQKKYIVALNVDIKLQNGMEDVPTVVLGIHLNYKHLLQNQQEKRTVTISSAAAVTPTSITEIDVTDEVRYHRDSRT